MKKYSPTTIELEYEYIFVYSNNSSEPQSYSAKV